MNTLKKWIDDQIRMFLWRLTLKYPELLSFKRYNRYYETKKLSVVLRKFEEEDSLLLVCIRHIWFKVERIFKENGE